MIYYNALQNLEERVNNYKLNFKVQLKRINIINIDHVAKASPFTVIFIRTLSEVKTFIK